MNLPNIRYECLQEKDYPAAREMLKADSISGEQFLRVLEKWPRSLTAAYMGDTMAALAQIERTSPQAYTVVFVSQSLRRQGIGSLAAAYAESELRASGARKVRTSFPQSNDAARAFAKKIQYSPYFSSACMQRTGSPFSLEPLPVRRYADADYPACQALYANAFHEMRVRVGCFPDSAVAKPSEKERGEWQADAANRFIYEEMGEIAAFGHIDSGELSSVAVDTRFQGRGIGRRFVMYLCNAMYLRGHDTVSLWCVVGNYARKLYESLGFEEKYISDFMRKTL